MTSTAVQSEQPVVFAHTVEGLLRAIGPLEPNALERVRKLGFDPARLDPAYPVEAYVALQRLAVELYAPTVPFEVGIEALGARFVDAYGTTVVGRAVLIAMRLVGPLRSLTRLTRTLKSGTNFFDTSLVEKSSDVYHLWLNRVTYPGWYIGLVRRGLEHAGANEVSVKVVSHEGAGRALTLEVTWR